jgi:hypothetical protein
MVKNNNISPCCPASLGFFYLKINVYIIAIVWYNSTRNQEKVLIMLNNREELMIIMAEECSEVAVECSKVVRFANQDVRQPQLETEIGDFMCMYELAVEEGMIDPAMVAIASKNKREKLKKWSNLNV